MDTRNAVAEAWGQAIKERRQGLLNQSRAEFADRIGVTRQMVRLWEEGVHAPSSQMQGRLINVLGIDPGTVAKLIQAGAA